MPIRFVYIEAGRTDEDRKIGDALLDDEHLKKAKNICVQKIETLVAENDIPHYYLAFILYRWKEFAGEDAPKKYVEKLCETQDGAINLIFALLVEGYSTDGRKTRSLVTAGV